MDLDAFDFARPQEKSLGQQASAEASASPSIPADMMEALLQGRPQQAGTGNTQVPQMPRMSDQQRQQYNGEQQEKSKSYQCIYPVYFDATRSREQGRRVKKSDAVANPLAREIVEALAQLGKEENVALQIVLEPTKTHPKDWANPGRVKVQVKKAGRPVSAKIQNSELHLRRSVCRSMKWICQERPSQAAPKRENASRYRPRRKRTTMAAVRRVPSSRHILGSAQCRSDLPIPSEERAIFP